MLSVMMLEGGREGPPDEAGDRRRRRSGLSCKRWIGVFSPAATTDPGSFSCWRRRLVERLERVAISSGGMELLEDFELGVRKAFVSSASSPPVVAAAVEEDGDEGGEEASWDESGSLEETGEVGKPVSGGGVGMSPSGWTRIRSFGVTKLEGSERSTPAAVAVEVVERCEGWLGVWVVAAPGDLRGVEGGEEKSSCPAATVPDGTVLSCSDDASVVMAGDDWRWTSASVALMPGCFRFDDAEEEEVRRFFCCF